MEEDLQKSIVESAGRLERWWDALDHQSVGLAVLFLGAVLLLRKPISRQVVGVVERFFLQRSSEFGTGTRDRLVKLVQILLVALGFLSAIEALELPDLAGGILRNLVATTAIAAVFATWYELAANFVAILKSGEFEPVTLEADWTTRVTQFAILLFGIAAVLEVWSVDISGALTGVGVLGAGLAIAAQDLVRNLIAGMTNQSEERFLTGDAIEVEGSFMGTVKRIDLRSTLVLGIDQIPRHVPNAELSNSIVKNYSRMEHRRVLETFRIVLSSSREQLEQVRSGLEEHLHSSGDFSLSEDAPKYVQIARIGESSIDLSFYAWTKSGAYTDYIAVCDRLALRAKEIVASAGTEFAYPTQTVRLAGGDQPRTSMHEP